MADFIKAYNITLKHEGGYSNDLDDVGKETYKGISRVYNSSWPGWLSIDYHKKLDDFPDNIYGDLDLDNDVKSFYKTKYWNVNILDKVSSQDIANEMFDTGVNMGVKRAAIFLQRAINYLNKNGKLYKDIVEDGQIGRNTINALNKCISYKGDSYIYKILNLLQGNHYLKYMGSSPKQEKYAYGWLKRVKFMKN